MPMPRKYGSDAERQAAYRLRCKELEPISANSIPSVLGRKRWRAMFGGALNLVEQAGREMEAYYEQRTESWQESERGEAFAEAMESVAEISSALRDMPPI
jgi:hypothetical protein